jgi:hypothetical protein
MYRNFKVVWDAGNPIGTPREIRGECVICHYEIDNLQNHYIYEDKNARICLTCVRELSNSYESIFNNKEEKFDK